MTTQLGQDVLHFVRPHIEQIAFILGANKADVEQQVVSCVDALHQRLSHSPTPFPAQDLLDQYGTSVQGGYAEHIQGGKHTSLLIQGKGIVDVLSGSDDSQWWQGDSHSLSKNQAESLSYLIAPIVLGHVDKTQHDQNRGVDQASSSTSLHESPSLESGKVSDDLESSEAWQADSNVKTGDAISATHSTEMGVGGRTFMTVLPLIVLVVIVILGVNYLRPSSSLGVSPIPDIRLPGFDAEGINRAFVDATTAVSQATTEQQAGLAYDKLDMLSKRLQELDLKAIAESAEADKAAPFFRELAHQLKTEMDQKPESSVVQGMRPAVIPILDRCKVFGQTDQDSSGSE